MQPFPRTQREKTMTIPLNYYKVLDADETMGPEEIQQKCDVMLDQIPEGQYSDIALGCRAHILRAAATCLMDQMAKDDYDETLTKTEPVVEVPMSQVPGVLALLQVRAFPSPLFTFIAVVMWLVELCHGGSRTT